MRQALLARWAAPRGPTSLVVAKRREARVRAPVRSKARSARIPLWRCDILLRSRASPPRNRGRPVCGGCGSKIVTSWGHLGGEWLHGRRTRSQCMTRAGRRALAFHARSARARGSRPRVRRDLVGFTHRLSGRATARGTLRSDHGRRSTACWVGSLPSALDATRRSSVRAAWHSRIAARIFGPCRVPPIERRTAVRYRPRAASYLAIAA